MSELNYYPILISCVAIMARYIKNMLDAQYYSVLCAFIVLSYDCHMDDAILKDLSTNSAYICSNRISLSLGIAIGRFKGGQEGQRSHKCDFCPPWY